MTRTAPMTDGITHARKMHYLTRGATFRTPHIMGSTNLPPRDAFTGEADVLDLYDRYTNLVTAARKHEYDARDKRAMATNAEAAYKGAIAEALATGKDTAKVKNDAPRLLAEAEAHEATETQARVELTRVSHPLAEAIAEAAPRLLAPSEKQMQDTAKTVTAAIAGLNEAWGAWGRAWHLRRLLGQFALTGGNLPNYQSSAPLPSEVAAALATLTDHLSNLERLKSDEANVQAWRDTEAAAHANNARYLQKND